MAQAVTHRPMKAGAGKTVAGKAGAEKTVAWKAGAVALFFVLSACVAQETYDEAELSAKHYQNQTIRQQSELSRLEEENRVLKAQLDAAKVQLSDASYTQEIDQRLQNLRTILSEIGVEPGDVTKFKVDGGYVYRVKDSILFDLGSAQIRTDGARILQEVAADIGSRPYGAVYVRGHTDNLPVVKAETKARFPHGNLQLSAARAVEVGAFLETQGKVEAGRLVVMGFGPSDPVAPNDSEPNRQKNRRVDIFVADATEGAPK